MLRDLIDMRNCQVLFSGTVLKTSEVLGSHNERYIRILERGNGVCLYLIYWDNSLEYDKKPNEPRGILDISDCKVRYPETRFDRQSGQVRYVSTDSRGGKVYLTKVKDLKQKSGWFGGSRESIDLELLFLNNEDFNAFCASVLQPMLENGTLAKEKCTSSKEPDRRSLKNNYKILGELGRGAFSTVYRAKDKHCDKIVAVKVVKLGKLPITERRKNMAYLKSEISIMKKLSAQENIHPNIITMIDSFTEGELSSRNLCVCITMELADGGELFDRIIERDHYSESDAKIIMRKLIDALRCMHKIGIVHRDLKPENMIFESRKEDSEVKITDFGLALDVNSKDCFRSNVVGTSGYYAPEVLSLYYGSPCDIWSMGVILYILLVGFPPFNAKNALEMRRVITKGHYSFKYAEWDDVSADAQNLVAAMLTVDPAKRLTAEQVLKHNWLKPEAQILVDRNSKDRVNRLKVFNARRKFKAAAMAVLLGQRFNIPKHVANIKSSSPSMSFEKDEIGKIQAHLKGFKSQHLDMIRNSFERHSSNGSHDIEDSKLGVTDIDTFSKIMSDLGYGALPLGRLFSLFDQNGDGVLEYNELLAGLALLEGTGEESLRLCFQLYDTDGSGDIDPEELSTIFRLVGYTTSNIEAEVAEDLGFVFDKIDVNKDGKISFDEFRSAVSSNEKLVRCFLSTRLSK